ncbi:MULTISPECIES: helix-turn-helix domain-containing protein [unclassified Archaeoglobus]|jgi:DNA-binding Lrp family transcriptional regulator|uniref:helix-turn-helix domain-containing protein n=1 Tax=unclassified Archaeoglobus TaxID=2643606 RepID=UPI0025C64382|nr:MULTISPECIES: helix-turn-helix domain-containing protein [unclassified Archaeoglobus]
MSIRDRIITILQEKPRTLKELAELTGYPVPSIEWHLLSLPVERRYVGSETYIVLVDSEIDSQSHDDGLTKLNESKQSPSSIFETEQSHHGLSYRISKNGRAITKSKDTRPRTHVDNVVDKPPTWVVDKPLDLRDIGILENLCERAKQILKLLYEGLTQSQIARKLRISRQAVHKWVKKFIKWGFIAEKGSHWGFGKKRDKLYVVKKAIIAFIKAHSKPNCQPRNNRDVSSPQKLPINVHRLQLAYHIVNQNQPFSTECQSYLKSYTPKGWTGHVYLITVNSIVVRIRALKYKVVAELAEDVEFIDKSAEEAAAEVIRMLDRAVQIWLREQYAKGVEIELDKPYLLSKPEWALKSKLIQNIMKKLRNESRTKTLMQNGGIVETSPIRLNERLWIDASHGEGHIESDNPEEIDLVREGLEAAIQLKPQIQQIQQRIDAIEACIAGGMSQQNFEDIMKSMFSSIEKRIERLERLFLERVERASKQDRMIQLINAIATLMVRLDNIERMIKGEP